MKKGYIFDMDGTLVDSMGMICRMDREIFKRLGLSPSEEALEAMRYIPLGDSSEYISRNFDVPYTETEITEILMATMREGYLTVGPKAGVLEYLELCRRGGIRMGIATATEPDIAREVSERLGIMSYMDTLVACSEVGASKDRPDVFIEAARRMGLDAADCVVFEDGLPGAESSKSAGFTVVGVYDETAGDEDMASMKQIADRYIYSFEDIGNTLI